MACDVGQMVLKCSADGDRIWAMEKVLDIRGGVYSQIDISPILVSNPG